MLQRLTTKMQFNTIKGVNVSPLALLNIVCQLKDTDAQWRISFEIKNVVEVTNYTCRNK